MSPTWRGFPYLLNGSKILLCESFDGETGPCPKAFSPWSPNPFLLQLTTVWICPLELREGHGGWKKALSYNQRSGGCKGLVPSSPTGPCAVPIWLIWPKFHISHQYLCRESKERCPVAPSLKGTQIWRIRKEYLNTEEKKKASVWAHPVLATSMLLDYWKRVCGWSYL